jgi:hypothetical protein
MNSILGTCFKITTSKIPCNRKQMVQDNLEVQDQVGGMRRLYGGPMTSHTIGCGYISSEKHNFFGIVTSRGLKL